MKIKISLALCLLSVILLISVSCTNPTINDSTLKDNKINTLNEIAPSLSQNDNIMLIKEKGYFDEFITLLENEYNTAKTAHLSVMKPQLELWNLSFEDTVGDVEKKAQEYLDKNYPGTKVGDNKFTELVDYYIHDTTTPTAKKAKEESDFGALYCYMSLYTQYPKDTSGKKVFSDDTYNLTLNQILEKTLTFEGEKILAQFMYDKGLSDSAPKSLTTKKAD